MDFSKLKNKLLIVLCLFIIILPFFLITFTYASETDDVIVSTTDGIVLSYTGYFVGADGFITYYFPIEEGYSYTVNLKAYNPATGDGNIRTGFANVIGEGEHIYNYLVFSNEFTYTFTSDDYEYFFFCFGNISSGNTIDYTITREPFSNMNSAINKLVNSVGFNQFWDTFSNAIPMISVVAVFVFGFVIVTYLYLKLSKGKEGL